MAFASGVAKPARTVDCFKRESTISEGVYGVVHRATDKETGDIVALKKVKLHKTTSGFPIHSLREMNLLLSLPNHPNVIKVREIVTSSKGNDVYMVMDYCHHDLHYLMQSEVYNCVRWNLMEIKCLMKQLLSGLAFLHENFILHRDLKTANLLLTNNGILKICDLGMSRTFGVPAIEPYTNLVVTLWYRAPELLLGSPLYSSPIDVWSIGCIMAELFTGQVLFQGEGELDQIKLVCNVSFVLFCFCCDHSG